MKSTKRMQLILCIFTLICLHLPTMISTASTTSGVSTAGYLCVDGDLVEGFLEVYPGTTHSIQVCGLPPEIDSGAVLIKVSDPESDWQTVPVVDCGGNKCTQPFDWTAPDVEEPTTYVVQYKDSDGNPSKTFVAEGTIKKRGHILVIPEFTLGTMAPIIAMLTGLTALSIKKRGPLVNT